MGRANAVAAFSGRLLSQQSRMATHIVFWLSNVLS